MGMESRRGGLKDIGDGFTEGRVRRYMGWSNGGEGRREKG